MTDLSSATNPTIHSQPQTLVSAAAAGVRADIDSAKPLEGPKGHPIIIIFWYSATKAPVIHHVVRAEDNAPRFAQFAWFLGLVKNEPGIVPLLETWNYRLSNWVVLQGDFPIPIPDPPSLPMLVRKAQNGFCQGLGAWVRVFEEHEGNTDGETIRYADDTDVRYFNAAPDAPFDDIEDELLMRLQVAIWTQPDEPPHAYRVTLFHGGSLKMQHHPDLWKISSAVAHNHHLYAWSPADARWEPFDIRTVFSLAPGTETLLLRASLDSTTYGIGTELINVEDYQLVLRRGVDIRRAARKALAKRDAEDDTKRHAVDYAKLDSAHDADRDPSVVTNGQTANTANREVAAVPVDGAKAEDVLGAKAEAVSAAKRSKRAPLPYTVATAINSASRRKRTAAPGSADVEASGSAPKKRKYRPIVHPVNKDWAAGHLAQIEKTREYLRKNGEADHLDVASDGGDDDVIDLTSD